MKIKMGILSGAAALFTVLPAGANSGAPRRLDLADVAAVVRVSEPQLSPDGKSIVFVVARPNVKEARYDKSLVLVDVAGGSERVLTYDRKGVSSPRWSPSGQAIAFLDSAQPTPAAAPAAGAAPAPPEKPPGAGSPKAEIFIMPMNGGDAHRITNSAQDVEQFAWSPDGREIAYAVADENPNQAEIDKHNDAFQVGDNDYLATAAALPSHLWLMPSSGGAARRLTSGTWSLPKGAPPSSPASPLAWSADGKSIAIVQQSTPNWGDSDLAVVAIVDVASGQIRKLTAHQALEGYPVYSPDGSRIAYWYSRDGDPNNETDLFVTASSGGNGVDLTRTLDRSIVRAEWSGDGKSLLVGAHDGVRASLWLVPQSGPAQKINLGNVDPAWSYWVDLSFGKDGALAFAGNTPTHPNEIYYLAPGGAQPRCLTSFNQEIAARDLGRAEQFDWKGPNGYREDGVVVYPPNFDPKRKYPLVLVIHGGPQSASTLVFSPLAQLLAAHDYIVFSPNYRGSDNLGNAYERAIFNDAGAGPGRDVIAGIEALEQKGFIDKSRIAVSGWSYGGYMTSWLIGHYGIWKAAVSGAAVNDLLHEYALSDNNVTVRYNFGGPPWSDKLLKAYQEQSPISYASHISTPTLILSDTGDARVPISESYLMYHALKDRNVPVEFYAYPVGGHFPSDPVRGPDVYRRWVDWIDRHLSP
ncbi:MAG TPA: S9 family peptidase [Steroidobacteraceae bacterium]